jgi:predicted alpha/beta hydrolase
MRFRDLIAAVKSSRDLDRSFVWTRGSQEALSEFRGSGFQYAKFTRQRKPRNRDMRFRDLIAAVKSSRDLDRSFVWTHGSQEALSEFRGSGFQYAKFTRQRKPRNRDMRFRDLIAAVKSSRDLDRSFVWTRGSQEALSEFRGSGFHNAKNTMHRKPRFCDMRNPD